jgi:hypothetical protein
VTCKKCDAENADYARYCWNCGTPIHVSKIQSQKNTLLRHLSHEWFGLSQVVPKLLYIGAISVFVFQLIEGFKLASPFDSLTYSIPPLLRGLASGLTYAGILISLAGITTTQRDILQKQRMRKFLHSVAACLLLIAIVLLAFAMFTDTASLNFSIADRLYGCLKSFVYYGLFASGLLVGFGELNASRQPNESQVFNPVINILYFAGIGTVIVGIIIASLSIEFYSFINHSFFDKAAPFLSDLGYYSVFYGGILAALARLISLRNRKRNTSESIDEKDEEDREEEEIDSEGSAETVGDDLASDGRAHLDNI